MAEIVSWIATVATVTAAFMTASNLGSKVTGYGFVVFTAGALCWIAVGAWTHQPALMWTNVVLTALDLFGIWRWLGRQTSVEQGARAAAEASEETPGEALFPVSLLTRGEVLYNGGPFATCIDAMAGRTSGRIAYVVVSQGGVAGVGETLRRLPWSKAHMEEHTLELLLSAEEFRRLPELEKDSWPSR
jgi:hypothetical protein